jgi:exosortase
MNFSRGASRNWYYFAFLICAWLPLFIALIPSWESGTYYSYGWLVPPAMVFFFLRRRDQFASRVSDTPSISKPMLFGTMILWLVLLLALRIIEGGNVHWRLPLWIHGAATTAITLIAIGAAEGRRAVFNYLPVFAFVLVAIPPPSAMEQVLVGELTDAVTTTGGDLAKLLGLPVETTQSAFVIAGNPVDVNDGCSGVRSFQSSLMASLFVGELFLLSLPSRLTLLLIGMAGAFLGNAVRVVLLIQAFASGGKELMEQRHDGVGLAALTLTYGIIIGVGFAMSRNTCGFNSTSTDRSIETATPTTTEVS